jgi:AraC-like DNA-binding protein
LCAIDKDFFNKVSDEMKHERMTGSAAPGGRISGDEPGFFDASLSTIMQLLRDEAKSGGPSGPFYTEHLAHTLAARLFTLMNRSISRKNPHPAGDLNFHILNQIIERIEANPLKQFDLAALEAKSRYSYTRFIHAFRAQTGLSLYRYIVRLRLGRAKRLMHNRSLTLLEIAFGIWLRESCAFYPCLPSARGLRSQPVPHCPVKNRQAGNFRQASGPDVSLVLGSKGSGLHQTPTLVSDFCPRQFHVHRSTFEPLWSKRTLPNGHSLAVKTIAPREMKRAALETLLLARSVCARSQVGFLLKGSRTVADNKKGVRKHTKRCWIVQEIRSRVTHTTRLKWR